MDAVVATSAETANYIPVPARIISHGVDTARYFPADDRSREWAGSELPGRFGIAIFGRVRHQKGTDLFVEAMCRLLPKFPDFTAVIVGAVTPEQIPYARQLKGMIAAAGLSQRIHFLGERPAAEIPLWFRRISIVVAPQRWEGFGLTPLEAMASGLPSVATRVGGNHELIEHEHSGLLVPSNDSAALAAALRRYLLDLGDCDAHELYDIVLREIEAPMLAEVMRHCEGNQSKAAATLGLNRATLRKKLREYGLA